jgi:olfactory receptor
MKPRLCVLLVAIPWVITNLHAVLYLSPTSIFLLFPLFCATLPYSKALLFGYFISDLMVFNEVG